MTLGREGPILHCSHNITLDALFKHHHMNHMSFRGPEPIPTEMADIAAGTI